MRNITSNPIFSAIFRMSLAGMALFITGMSSLADHRPSVGLYCSPVWPQAYYDTFDLTVPRSADEIADREPMRLPGRLDAWAAASSEAMQTRRWNEFLTEVKRLELSETALPLARLCADPRAALPDTVCGRMKTDRRGVEIDACETLYTPEKCGTGSERPSGVLGSFHETVRLALILARRAVASDPLPARNPLIESIATDPALAGVSAALRKDIATYAVAVALRENLPNDAERFLGNLLHRDCARALGGNQGGIDHALTGVPLASRVAQTLQTALVMMRLPFQGPYISTDLSNPREASELFGPSRTQIANALGALARFADEISDIKEHFQVADEFIGLRGAQIDPLAGLHFRLIYLTSPLFEAEGVIAEKLSRLEFTERVTHSVIDEWQVGFDRFRGTGIVDRLVDLYPDGTLRVSGTVPFCYESGERSPQVLSLLDGDGSIRGFLTSTPDLSEEQASLAMVTVAICAIEWAQRDIAELLVTIFGGNGASLEAWTTATTSPFIGVLATRENNYRLESVRLWERIRAIDAIVP